jgi:hypothetical protein
MKFLMIAVIFILATQIFKPVPIVTESECLIQSGIVTAIDEGGTNDVVIRLKDNDEMFYINRGLEQGLDLGILKSTLIGNEVILKYPKHWTPLDPYNKTHHVSKVEHGEHVIFDELK